MQLEGPQSRSISLAPPYRVRHVVGVTYSKKISTLDAIKARRSVRSFDPRGLAETEVQAVREILGRGVAGPFGGRARFEFLDRGSLEPRDRLRLGTYGTIRGARYFMVGAIERRPRACEDFGFCMEDAILRITALGLGTCWLGGIFRRKWFARAMHLEPDEDLLAASPVGPAAQGRGIVQAFAAGIVGARSRLPWEELFHIGREGVAAQSGSVGAYARVLEGVRLGPSASNRQPWRMVLEPDRDIFHLFLRRTPGYDLLAKADLQRVDAGIAMLHFQAVATELGLMGRWKIADPEELPEGGSWEYVATWRGERA